MHLWLAGKVAAQEELPPNEPCTHLHTSKCTHGLPRHTFPAGHQLPMQVGQCLPGIAPAPSPTSPIMTSLTQQTTHTHVTVRPIYLRTATAQGRSPWTAQEGVRPYTQSPSGLMPWCRAEGALGMGQGCSPLYCSQAEQQQWRRQDIRYKPVFKREVLHRVPHRHQAILSAASCQCQ